MRPTASALAHLAAPVLGIPAAVAGALPTWPLIALLTISALLAATQTVVTQIIRLRASNRIIRSSDNLRVLEIEDLPHHPPPRTRPEKSATPSPRRPAAQRRASPDEPAKDSPPT